MAPQFCIVFFIFLNLYISCLLKALPLDICSVRDVPCTFVASCKF